MAVLDETSSDAHCKHLNSDVLAGVLAFADPQVTVAMAQSCKELYRAHRALAANLHLEELQQRSSHHVLGVSPDMAYVQLVVPHAIVRLAAQHLTAFDIDKVVLALKPELSHLQRFVQRQFGESCSSTLLVSLQIPGDIAMIRRRFALAPMLRALVNTVTRDLKAVISSYAQDSLSYRGSSSLKVYYDLEVNIQLPAAQTAQQLYTDVENQMGQDVAQAVFGRKLVQCDMTGLEFAEIAWKETGLLALFGRLPSLPGSKDGFGICLDGMESGSAQLWRFTSTASQVVSVHCSLDAVAFIE
ncbi:hypothetical protein ABBQ38_012184 [Trebouxia sp. C0009 RCD-2024]